MLTLGGEVGRLGESVEQFPDGDADLAPYWNVDAVEPAQRHRVVIDLDRRFVLGDPRVVREARAEDGQQVRLVHEVACDGRSASIEEARRADASRGSVLSF